MFYQQLQLTASGSAVKALPAVQNKRVQPLGGEDPLEKGMATHSSILAWRIPWTEEPGGLYSMGSQRVMTKHTCTNVDWNNYYSPWPWKTKLQRTWWLEVRDTMQFFSALETIKISLWTQLWLETCHQETSYLLFIIKVENSGEPWLSECVRLALFCTISQKQYLK